MSIKEIVIELVTIIPILTGILYFVLKHWLLNKIQFTIKAQYDKQLEEFKHSITVKTKASLIADLLSEWLSFPEDQKLLNKLTFEAFLWLPKDIASDLSDLLSHKPESKSVRHIISDVRKHLLSAEEAIEDHQIIVFTQEYRKKMINKQQVTKASHNRA